MFKRYISRCTTLLVAMAAVLAATPASATDLSLSDSPLSVAPAVAPLNMLVVGRDHKLYYEAYNDASDLDGDGRLDVGYKGYLPNPTLENPNAGGIDYYGYFDSYKCYTYANNLFSPSRITADKRCGGANEWSGDYLNYLTTARIDALRKVLYGGKRDVDTATSTVLIRSHIPMDAHSWGKEASENDPFDIRDYTPFSTPTSGKRHLFANTTPNSASGQTPWYNETGQPLLRVLENTDARIWEWVSKESPVAGTSIKPRTGTDDHQTITIDHDYTVRVAVCVSQELIGKENCRAYPARNYKPVGLLHEFGENDSMLFGLLSGSYTANKSGGVLRKNIGSITDEVDSQNGRLTNSVGIIRTLDRLRVAGYSRYTNNGGGGGTNYDCGLPAMAQGAPLDGNCRMWGNPVAEMMYETLRYFRGMSPTPAFTAVYGSSNTDIEDRLSLPRANWTNPYGTDSSGKPRPYCAKPFQTVMADINNSYDSDQLPGSVFALETGSNQISNALPGLDVSALANQITANEPDIPGLRFIGQSGNNSDGAPTAKNVTSLANIRGLAPEEPTKQGSYYPASVAYHGRTQDISTATGTQNVQTFAVALASPLPKIEIPVAGGRKVTLVPFAKSVRFRERTGGSDRNPVYTERINRNQGQFQPTNQIVDFYVEELAADGRSGTIQVNFEDVEAGNDHDMDAIVRYKFRVNAQGQVEVDVSSDYQAGGLIHHIGYVISGTTADGVYLVVQDCNRDANGGYICNGNNDWDYFLDTPPGAGPGERPFDNVGLPGSSSRTFTPASGAAAATVLKDPLWYAAKWGGFTDSDDNNRPNLDTEWSNDGGKTPSNYFLVTNALKLSQQLRTAFASILDRSAAASSASVNSGSISTDTRIYQSKFNTRDWTGELFGYNVDPRTGKRSEQLWNAAQKLANVDQNDRRIITVNSNNVGVPFRWDNLDGTRKSQLSDDENQQKQYVRYLRGENFPGLRGRSFKLGDIVSSAPIYVAAPRARYSDSMPGTTPYSQFVLEQRNRNAMLYVGANDGMLHGFDAGGALPANAGEDPDGGREVFAFIPKTVFPNLKYLPQLRYQHKFYVDGSPNSNDVYINDRWRTVLVGGLNQGGQGIYALDVTDPALLANAEANANSIRLWEFTDQDDKDLGYTYGTPAIVRLQDGSWAAVFGNGYNNTVSDGNTTTSTTGNAVLYIVNIANGQLIKRFDTGVGMSDPRANGKPNGLATPVMVDVDGDRIVDHAYAGDLLGNLWKFDLRSTDYRQWDFAFKKSNGAPDPLFVATDSNSAGGNVQPITVRPEVARGPYGAGVMVLFGTGKFLETTDKDVPATTPPKQSFYGLVDRNTYTASDRIVRSNLVQQTITAQATTPRRTRTTSMNGSNGNGFYLDLAYDTSTNGERAVTDPLVRGDRVIFTTLIPNNQQCDFGGRSWLMVLDLLSGARLQDAQLDSDGDGDIDGNDRSISGVGTENEILSRPESLLCLSGDCNNDRLLSSGSSGRLNEEAVRSIGGIWGRQSWRQIR